MAILPLREMSKVCRAARTLMAVAAVFWPCIAVGADWTGYLKVAVPFRSAQFQQFQQGMPQEGQIVSRYGNLVGYLRTPPNLNRPPFVILLHGCSGLSDNTSIGLQAWANWFNEHNIGALVLDSFGPRHVGSTCGDPDGHWSHRRSDDAFSAAQFLIDGGWSRSDRLYALGQSNGARVAINLASASQVNRPLKFAALFSLYPYCGDDQRTEFFRPLTIFAAELDVANKPEFCTRLDRNDRRMLKPGIVLIPGATHGYDVNSRLRSGTFVASGRTVTYTIEYSEAGLVRTREVIERMLADSAKSTE